MIPTKKAFIHTIKAQFLYFVNIYSFLGAKPIFFCTL